jgi:hypothetical protein
MSELSRPIGSPIKSGEETHLPIPYRQLLKSLNMSPTTGWRLRKRGWLRTHAVAGKLYVPHQALELFLSRLEAGEFLPKSRANGKETEDAR